MNRLLAFGLTVGVLLTALGSPGVASTKELAVKKEALRELQEFIGDWKGSGSKKMRPGPRDPFWGETVKWNWRFKGDDCWLAVEFQGGKLFQTAEVRYLPDTKKYQLTATPAGAKGKLVFDGALKDEKLTFERVDPKTKEVRRVRMNTAADGIRFIYLVDRRDDGATVWRLEAVVESTKVGESLARKQKKGPECVVSGGLGTMTVSYMGETFYVCCSGCRDAFNENPKKYVDEFKAKKK
jgi:hypothetical protein